MQRPNCVKLCETEITCVCNLFDNVGLFPTKHLAYDSVLALTNVLHLFLTLKFGYMVFKKNILLWKQDFFCHSDVVPGCYSTCLAKTAYSNITADLSHEMFQPI